MGTSPKKKRRGQARSTGWIARRRNAFGPSRDLTVTIGGTARNRATNAIGRRLASVFNSRIAVPRITHPPRLRRNVFSRFFRGRELHEDDVINRTYRAAYRGQDELYSTALTREVVKGFLEQQGFTRLTDPERELLDELIDVASSARIPTEHSGYARAGEAMQHPANHTRAHFADPHDTASLHSRMDTERRNVVERAMTEAADARRDAAGILVEGVKAAIEYTLNFFTAPVTASNVHPFTRRSGQRLDDPELQEQLASRERMKALYVELGGQLRVLQSAETLQESWSRAWMGGRRDAGGEPLRDLPSPRRRTAFAPAPVLHLPAPDEPP